MRIAQKRNYGKLDLLKRRHYPTQTFGFICITVNKNAQQNPSWPYMDPKQAHLNSISQL